MLDYQVSTKLNILSNLFIYLYGIKRAMPCYNTQLWVMGIFII